MSLDGCTFVSLFASLLAGCTATPSIANGAFDSCPSGLAGGQNGPTRCAGTCNAPDYALSPNLGTPTAVCKDSGSWEVTGACLRGELQWVMLLPGGCGVRLLHVCFNTMYVREGLLH